MLVYVSDTGGKLANALSAVPIAVMDIGKPIAGHMDFVEMQSYLKEIIKFDLEDIDEL